MALNQGYSSTSSIMRTKWKISFLILDIHFSLISIYIYIISFSLSLSNVAWHCQKVFSLLTINTKNTWRKKKEAFSSSLLFTCLTAKILIAPNFYCSYSLCTLPSLLISCYAYVWSFSLLFSLSFACHSPIHRYCLEP